MAETSIDDLSMDSLMNCLTGGASSTEAFQPAAPALADHGPRSRGGFAATGKAIPLTFDDLHVGLILIHHPSTANTSIRSLGKPAQSGSKDLLAALRAKVSANPAVGTPSSPPSIVSAKNAQEKSISENFVVDSTANSLGLDDAQMQQLSERLLVVVGLNSTDKTVVTQNAAQKQVIIHRFGAPSSNGENGSYYRAGQVEEALFARWRESPEELLAIGSKRAREEDPPITFEALVAPKLAAEKWWWVVRGLLVRYVPADETVQNFGRKGTVVEYSRKDDRIMLKCSRPTEDEGSAFTMITCCQSELETVVPRVGERGMVLRPSLAGELVTVLCKTKDKATGDPILTVEVNDESILLKAEEICVLSHN